MAFTSHIDGRDAEVLIYSDRIEWMRTKWGFLFGNHTDTNMVLVRKIEGVNTSHAGWGDDYVKVVAGAVTVEFCVPQTKAAEIKATITRLMLES